MEIELKLILEADEAARLRAHLGVPLREVEQINHYFDDEAGTLLRAGWGVRLREESEGLRCHALLTAKHAGQQKAGFSHRPEYESGFPLKRCADWLQDPAGLMAAVARLCPPLGEFVPLDLVRTGTMRNRRAIFALPAQPQFSIELDRTTWPDASVSWEAELEIGEGQSVAVAEVAMRALFASLEVPWRCGEESKLARLMRMLGTQGE